MKTYTNFQKIFLVRVFWLKYIFLIKFKISILDLMLLPKNKVFHLKGSTPVSFEKLFTHPGTKCNQHTRVSTLVEPSNWRLRSSKCQTGWYDSVACVLVYHIQQNQGDHNYISRY